MVFQRLRWVMAVAISAWCGASMAGTILPADSIMGQYNSLLYFVHNVLSKICVLSAAALILGGLAQYKAHRDTPGAVKLSVPIAMIVIGLLLLGLAYLPSPIEMGRLK